MKVREFINFMNVVEKLKCNTRHSWTSSGRQESVAEHSWRLALMAMMCKDEYSELDIDRVIKMCLIHDLGEAIMGDIPSFLKTKQNELDEEKAIETLLGMLPFELHTEWAELFEEMSKLESREAKLYKSLDNMEALISHNEADISTWLPLEYTENLIYGQMNVEWSEWTRQLKEEIKLDSLKKIDEAKKRRI